MKALHGGLVALAFVMCTSVTSAQGTGQRPRVLATINGFNVTPSYLTHVIEHRFAREIMEEIVRARVIEDEARARGIRVSAEEVTARLAREQARFPSQQDFNDHLAQMGFTLKGYREHLRTQLLLEKLMNQTAEVSDVQAKAYYDAHPGQFRSEPELHILHLSSDSREDATVAYRAILDGTPFEVAARRFGSGSSGQKSGDLGWVTQATIPIKGLWEPAAALREGDLTEPFELDGRFHIMRLVGRRAGRMVPFEDVREEIKARLREQGGLTEADYVASLIARANITISWDPVRYLQDEYLSYKGIRVAVDGRVLRLKALPFATAEGVMMVPAKAVLNAVGATVLWRAGPKILEVKRGARTASINLGEKIALINGERVDMGAPALVKNGALYIPARAVLVGLGLTVQWNPRTRLLSVSTGKLE